MTSEVASNHPEYTSQHVFMTNSSILEQDSSTDFNVTEHTGFLHGFVESLSVIVVSKLCKKQLYRKFSPILELK